MATSADAEPWSRRRLVAMLAGLVGFALVVIGGLGFAVAGALHPDSTAASADPGGGHWPLRADGTRGDGYRNAVAAAHMLTSTAGDMTPAPPALDRQPTMLIPDATTAGPAGVPSGYPHTPSGAVAQLAAIETAALTPMSVQDARAVHAAWASDPAGFGEWELAQSIRAFHEAAGTVDGDGSVTLLAVPVGAQVKATDGPDWVLACVQLDITITVVEQTRFGYGHCDRMHWAADRWLIAPGTPPAPAPSTWPGSQRSLDAGWRRWVQAAPTS